MQQITYTNGAPVVDNTNTQTPGPCGRALLQDIWLLERLAHFDREVIPKRRMHAKSSGAFGQFTVTNDITGFTKARLFGAVGKTTEAFVRFSTFAGERGAADAERDIHGFAVKLHTEEGNWDLVGNNAPVFFLRDPLRFSDLNQAVKRDPRTNLRSAQNNWDFWTLLPEALHQVTYVMRDRGLPDGYRYMHGFGSHTFSFINVANDRCWVKFHLRSQQGSRGSQPWDGHEMNTYADDLATVMNTLNLKSAVIVGFSTGDGEVARYIGRHGSQRVDGSALMPAVPPLMLKTVSNPGGLPIEVSDAIRAGEIANSFP